MVPAPPPLPIDAVLPALTAALDAQGRAVLVAPPGAGKTTRVPLALLDRVPGRILMLEPRRLAARAAAERLAATLGEAPGARVGFRMRGEAVPGSRIEVVTEGILTRMVQADPGLEGVGAVIFDEFHERSLNADLGLALVWEAMGALRPDLRLLVMSATLDPAPVAALLGEAPMIVAEGRAFPVATHWLDRPLPGGARWLDAVAPLVRQALDASQGTVLVFLPGEAEIRRAGAALAGCGAEILPLYGALPAAAQRAALAPPASGGPRRVVLATAIAETSLTIPGVRAVVDAGRARRARHDAGSGMSRLVTERVSRAEADQRRGRAGREAPGVCFRLWAQAEEGALPAFAPPEIATADLAGLALDLAAWGAADGAGLAFLTPPPAAALAEARGLLAGLGAVDAGGRITAHGRALARLPLHPRLAHMLAVAGPGAADLAALLAAPGELRGAGTDLAAARAAMARAPEAAPLRAEAARLRRLAPRGDGVVDQGDTGALAALAYPDRVGLRRPGAASDALARYALAGGKGAALDAGDPVAAARLIVATDTDGHPTEARVRRAAALDESTLRAVFTREINVVEAVTWSRREGRVKAVRQERFGALVLAETPLATPDGGALAAAAWDGMRDEGLPWSAAARRLRDRLAAVGEAVDEAELLSDPGWLLPWLGGVRTRADLRGLDIAPALLARTSPAARRRLEDEAPAAWTLPGGRRVAVSHDGDTPMAAVRLQDVIGVTRHPVIGGKPLRISLLSPAGREIAVTGDLPGFWAGSYAEVRKQLRGRYPKHPWPEDPTVPLPPREKP